MAHSASTSPHMTSPATSGTPQTPWQLMTPTRLQQALARVARLRDCASLHGLFTHQMYEWAQRVRTPSPVGHAP
eukprot:11630821-Alexandrium_andersonii.AAC.1